MSKIKDKAAKAGGPMLNKQFLELIKKGDKENMDKILKGDEQAKVLDMGPAVHQAIQYEHGEDAKGEATGIAEMIINSSRADLEAKNDEGQTPLVHAIMRGEHELAVMLIGKDVSKTGAEDACNAVDVASDDNRMTEEGKNAVIAALGGTAAAAADAGDADAGGDDAGDDAAAA